ncbi:MAG: hypothetical protein Kow0062_27250 [Acidobacteriota bacterium]
MIRARMPGIAIAVIVLLGAGSAAAQSCGSEQTGSPADASSVAVIHNASAGFQIVSEESGPMQLLVVNNEPYVIFKRAFSDPNFTQEVVSGPGAGKLTLNVGLGAGSGTHMMTCTPKTGVPDFDSGTCCGSIGYCEECVVKPKPSGSGKNLGTHYISE